MAHMIEEMFSVGETPWHGLGRVLTSAPTVKDAIREAGLDWQIKTLPLYLSDGRQNPDAFANVRETDNAILGTVGPRYHVLQNRDAFSFFDPLVDSGLVTLETAGSLQGGKKVWVLARISGGDLSVGGDDTVRKYVLLSNSHDGSLAIRAGFVPVRVVCANTLSMAHQDADSALVRIRHMSSAKADLDLLRDTMNFANQQFEATVEQYRALSKKSISGEDLERYVKVVFGDDPDIETDELSKFAQNRLERVVSIFEGGRGMDLKTTRGTVYGAYNAVTEYLSHEAKSNADSRYRTLWFGANKERNFLALNEAMKLAA